jgi:hypothetical protein
VVVFANDDGARMSRWAPLDASLHHAMTGGGSSAASVAACVGRLLRTARRPEARHAAQSVELPPAMGAQDPPEAVA